MRVCRLFFFFLFGCCFGGLSVSAFAQAAPWGVVDQIGVRTSTGTRVVAGGALTQLSGTTAAANETLASIKAAASYTPTAVASGGSGVTVKSAVALVTDNGQLLKVEAARTIPRSALARGGIALARLNGYALAIMALPFVWDAAKGYWATLNTKYPAPVGGKVWTHQNGGLTCVRQDQLCTFEAAVDAAVAAAALSSGRFWVVKKEAPWSYDQVLWQQPALVDGAFNGQLYLRAWDPLPGTPAPSDPPGQKVLDEDMEAALNNKMSSDPSKQLDLASLLKANNVPVEHTDLEVLTGPEFAPAQVTRMVQMTDAGPRVQEVSKQHRFSYDAANRLITDSVVTTSTVTEPSGAVKVETSTEDPPSGEGVSVGKTDCQMYPNSLGCVEIGAAKEAVSLPEVTKEVSLQKEFSGSGSCPADKTFTVRGNSFSLSYGPVCTFVSSVRGLVIALAYLSAFLWCFYVWRSGK